MSNNKPNHQKDIALQTYNIFNVQRMYTKIDKKSDPHFLSCLRLSNYNLSVFFSNISRFIFL